jgi:hypothetical protein
VFDAMVTYQFYQQQRYVFAYVSIGIFCMAQLSYALLFTATWSKGNNNNNNNNNDNRNINNNNNNNNNNNTSILRQVVVYICILPFAQLVGLVIGTAHFSLLLPYFSFLY